MTQLMHDILQLNIADRINIVEAIWDSIAENSGNISLSDTQKTLLDQRLEDHRQNPDEGSEWEVVRDRIKKQM